MSKQNHTGIFRKLEKGIYYMSRGLSLIVPIFLIAIMLLVVTNVFLRTIFNDPIVGTNEIVECMIACAGFLSMAWCTINNMNIRVDILSRKLKPGIARLIEGITATLSLGIVPLLFWQHLQKTLTAYNSQEMTSILRFQLYPVYGIITIGFFVLIFAQLVITVKAFIREDKQ